LLKQKDWRKELRKYVTKYRGIYHATTSKSPAELLFNHKIRGKLLELHSDLRPDLEVSDRDAELKPKTKKMNTEMQSYLRFKLVTKCLSDRRKPTSSSHHLTPYHTIPDCEQD